MASSSERNRYNAATWLQPIQVSCIMFFFILVLAQSQGASVEMPYADHHQRFGSSQSSSLNTSTPILPRALRTNPEDMCLTAGCIMAASEVMKNMDNSVDPCDDFYKFACGKYIKEKQISSDKSAETALGDVNDVMYKRLRSLLEEPARQDEPRPYRMAKEYYNDCLNTTRIEEIGLAPLRKVLKSLGGWPVLERRKWLPASFTWKDTVYKLKKEGFDIGYLFSLDIVADFKNSSKHVIMIGEPSLNLARDFLVKGLEDKRVEALYNYMVDIAVMLGADRESAITELKKSLEFQINLAKITLPKEEMREPDKRYNPMKMNELQTKFPSIPWFEYFSKLLPSSVKLKWDEVVIVSVPSYIRKMEALLSTTPKRVVSNYLLWRVVSSSVPYVSEAMRGRELEYVTALTGKTKQAPRWKECVTEVNGVFSLVVGSLYAKRFFTQKARENVAEMIRNIRNEMIKILKTVKWMDNKTRESALEKAEVMDTHVAYPDELLDVKKLEHYYSRLQLKKGEYFESALEISKFTYDKDFNKLRKPRNKTDWRTHGRIAMVNAQYSPTENSINIPAGILQGALYSSERPNYMNYGAIGFAIGHEISHGFDDQGRKFDKGGNLIDWWAPKTAQAYIKKASCIVHQYESYTVSEVGLKLNGVISQGENIADNAGMKEAYWAYLQWVAQHGVEKRLPGLHRLSPQQMFWVSAANTWCSKFRPEALKLEVITGVHSPGEFRIIGPLSNRPEFARDFNCPLGSRMNPVKKCQIW